MEISPLYVTALIALFGLLAACASSPVFRNAAP